MASFSETKISPRIIIHGGAGNLTQQSISREDYAAYQASLRNILARSAEYLKQPGANALDVATFAVTMLEDDPLYNSGRGAVFTREGKNELECSIMVSSGYKKRGVGCMMLEHVKNPIKLARELLIRGEMADGGGAKDHCQYSGAFAEKMAAEWGLEIVNSGYFFTHKRWEEHKRGLLEEEKRRRGGIWSHEMSDWEKLNYIPLGTCGAVVLDSSGTICVATSTGGLTNKVPGRIGDTPTMGAGFWAEQWMEAVTTSRPEMMYKSRSSPPLEKLSRGDVYSLVADCLPTISLRDSSSSTSVASHQSSEKASSIRHAVGMSGTGNGDSFIRMAACTTTASKSRFSPTSLSKALSWMSGPGGELQKSAGDRWGHTHEGTGGMIGIELVGDKGTVVWDYNCGGMFRAWTEENGEHKCLIFREDRYESGPKGWLGN